MDSVQVMMLKDDYNKTTCFFPGQLLASRQRCPLYKTIKKEYEQEIYLYRTARPLMKHLTPYRQNETSLSPVMGRGMVYGIGLIKEFA